MKLDGNYCGRLPPIAWSRWFPGRLCPWLALVAALLASDRLESGVIYVQPSGADAQAGTSWSTAKRTVTAALTAAHAGDEIWVAAGTYFERISLRKDVALYGGFAGGGIACMKGDTKSNLGSFADGQSEFVIAVALRTNVSSAESSTFSVQLGNPVNGAELGDPSVIAVTLVSSPSAPANPWNVPSAWIDQHGLTLTGTSDADGDGFLDRFEYFAGTHPRDSESCLRLLSATPTHRSLPRPMVFIASNLIRNPQSHR